MQHFIVETKEDSEKSRSFRGTLVAAATVHGALFEEGANGNTIRPAWAVFAGTEAELRPFIANLRLGRKLQPNLTHKGDDGRLEFLKGVGYEVSWQREPEGCLVTVYHPEIFKIDPGMIDPKIIGFVLLVPEDWAATQQNLRPEEMADFVSTQFPKVERSQLLALVPTAHLFAAYLERRTRCPLIADGRFYLQILCAALDAGLASFPGADLKHHSMWHQTWGQHKSHYFHLAPSVGYHSEFKLESVGIRHAISFLSNHVDFEVFLADQTLKYFEAQEPSLSFECAS